MIKSIGGVAQLVEQRDHNPWAVGSSPSSAIFSALIAMHKKKRGKDAYLYLSYKGMLSS
jgi:hypothetical protein